MVPFYRQRIVVQSCYYIIVACCLVPARLISVCCITQTWEIPKCLMIWRHAALDLGGPHIRHTSIRVKINFPSIMTMPHTIEVRSVEHHTKSGKKCLPPFLHPSWSGCHQDVQGLLPHAMIHAVYMYWCLISVYRVVIFPCMFHHGQIFCHSLIIGVPVLLSSCLQSLFGFLNVQPAGDSSRGCDNHIRVL